MGLKLQVVGLLKLGLVESGEFYDPNAKLYLVFTVHHLYVSAFLGTIVFYVCRRGDFIR
jgi:hypothetical protein